MQSSLSTHVGAFEAGLEVAYGLLCSLADVFFVLLFFLKSSFSPIYNGSPFLSPAFAHLKCINLLSCSRTYKSAEGKIGWLLKKEQDETTKWASQPRATFCIMIPILK